MNYAIVSTREASANHIGRIVAPHGFRVAATLNDLACVIAGPDDVTPARRALAQAGILALEIDRDTAELLIDTN